MHASLTVGLEHQRRRLTFDVEVAGPTESISTGTHQRAEIDLGRFS